ncbi:MAG TPA: hypothetical protein VHT74_20330 [Acetobacteraceae bacterium]|jgi:hypothetical protein|nr:hypothetical protein [Acetobacteraceae bacterium]
MTRCGAVGLAIVLACGPPVAARADSEPPVPVRSGSHEGYGRIVFDMPSRTEYRLTQQGQRVVIQFVGDMTIGSATGVPRNVVGLTGGANQAELTIAPGTSLHDWRLGDHIVIDILDPVAASTAPERAAETPQPGVDNRPSPAEPTAKPAATGAAAPPVPPPSTVPAAKPAANVAAPPVPTPPTAPPAKPAANAAAPLGPPPPTAPAAKPAANAAVSPTPPPPIALAAKPATNAVAPPSTPTVAQAPRPPVAPGAPTPAAVPLQSKPVAASVPPEPATAAVVPPPLAAAAAPMPDAPPATREAQPAVGPVADTGEPPAPKPDSVLVVPFESPSGVAAFRRGNQAVIVFDQRGEVDTAPLRDDPVFGSAVVQDLPTATVIRVPLDAGMALAVSQTGNTWRIAAAPSVPNLQPITAALANDRLVFQANAPGTVMTVADPDTGMTLLVGTQRRQGQGVPVRHRTPEFVLLPTWQGVAVEAIADTLALRPTQTGFVLSGGVGGLAVSPPSDVADLLARSSGLTRRFDFPSQPATALLQHLRVQVLDDATTPPLARGPRREEVARTMISLGLGAEAQAVLQIAAADDPHEAASADNVALASIAALLAHRPEEASGLSDSRLAGWDDIALWQGIRRAELQEGSANAAAVFSATLPLLLAYPAEIRDRLLPLAAETLVAGGELATAIALLDARKDDATLDLARGMLQEIRGENPAALATYDRLAHTKDQSVHARAAVRAVELRLASGQLDVGQAADRLDKLLYNWRGDLSERALREHLAELRARSGAWRAALGLLRETEAIFPDDKAAIHAELTDMFAALLRGDAADALAPLELAALVDENADLLPAGPDGEALEARLADRLVSLDLPKRAGPVLEKLAQAAPTETGRAGFGTRLAALRLREGDATGALAALAASAAADLPPALEERRTLLAADANARRGDTDRALSALGSLATAAADEGRASILERANDWPAAQRALADYVAKAVPREGRLDDGQRRILLRFATAAARAGDEATLAALRQREAARMETGPLADMFRLLTADQVRGVGDLKRSGQEATLARALPGQLKELQPPVRLTP